LLIDEALDYYEAHEDIIFNFHDLRELLLMKQNILTQLRTVSALNSMETIDLSKMTSMLTSTRIPTDATSRTESFGSIPYSSVQSIEELTQHDIRKAIIEDL
jgi:hypothetical protein